MTGKPSTIKDYQERINKVLWYIQNHLDERFDVNQLAAMANFSPYHFHRIVKAFINEPIGAYIVRTRLDTAAQLLTYSELPLQDIAYKIGYEAPSSFNKAFKKRFNISPTDFKEKQTVNLAPANISDLLSQKVNMKLEPKIIEIPNKLFAYVQSIGEYDSEGTGLAWQEIFSFIKKNKLFSMKMDSFGISYDNPEVTESHKCRYEACVSIPHEAKPEGRVGVKEIEGGVFAVFRLKGPFSQFSNAYNAIFREWYPSSGKELREAPIREKYINYTEKRKPEKYITDLYIPVK